MNTLGQSEKTFRILVEGAPAMIWLARSDGFMEYFNPHALAFMGLPGEELCGGGWRKLIHPDDAPGAQAAWDQATKVWVHLGEEQDAIVLEVEDNGVGISPAQLAERRSLGLLGMRERAGAFGGAVEIVGSKGQGTTVIVQMPVLKTNDENFDR